MKRYLPEAKLVFLTPPTWEELVARLQGRGTEDQAAQERRLLTARGDLESVADADHVVVNVEVEETVAALVDLMGL